ncbi:hypothetical protein PROFUN_16507 [Planoprotostelium fungivorum]|uniref:Uncharacterized protein n=1 Tax=Planoprotostelium fungivorum TaxID=1890364 RepID=A0A2P6MQ78_9EUKA|nr:hypothetical protein PROFUN_16507 [Planoprotostelium fungivorum]
MSIKDLQRQSRRGNLNVSCNDTIVPGFLSSSLIARVIGTKLPGEGSGNRSPLVTFSTKLFTNEGGLLCLLTEEKRWMKNRINVELEPFMEQKCLMGLWLCLQNASSSLHTLYKVYSNIKSPPGKESTSLFSSSSSTILFFIQQQDMKAWLLLLLLALTCVLSKTLVVKFYTVAPSISASTTCRESGILYIVFTYPIKFCSTMSFPNGTTFHCGRHQCNWGGVQVQIYNASTCTRSFLFEKSATKKHIQCMFIEKEHLGFLWFEIILYKQRLIELFGSYVNFVLNQCNAAPNIPKPLLYCQLRHSLPQAPSNFSLQRQFLPECLLLQLQTRLLQCWPCNVASQNTTCTAPNREYNYFTSTVCGNSSNVVFPSLGENFPPINTTNTNSGSVSGSATSITSVASTSSTAGTVIGAIQSGKQTGSTTGGLSTVSFMSLVVVLLGALAILF